MGIIKYLLGWPLSLIAILFIIKIVIDRSDEIIPHLYRINISYLLISAIFFFVYYFSRSVLWKEILKNSGYKINLLDNTYRFGISELKRFVPGNIWSFLSRAVLFNEIGVDKTTIAKGLLTEVQLIIIGCLSVSIFSFPWILDADPSLKLKLFSLLPVSFIAIFIFFGVTAYIFKRKYSKKDSLLSFVFLPEIPMRQKARLIVISIFVFAAFGLANFMVFLAVFPDSISQIVILSSFFTFSLLVGYLSFITPMGLGVREGVITLGLLKTMNIAQAGFFAIFSRIVLIFSELIYLFSIFLLYKFKK